MASKFFKNVAQTTNLHNTPRLDLKIDLPKTKVAVYSKPGMVIRGVYKGSEIIIDSVVPKYYNVKQYVRKYIDLNMPVPKSTIFDTSVPIGTDEFYVLRDIVTQETFHTKTRTVIPCVVYHSGFGLRVGRLGSEFDPRMREVCVEPTNFWYSTHSDSKGTTLRDCLVQFGKRVSTVGVFDEPVMYRRRTEIWNSKMVSFDERLQEDYHSRVFEPAADAEPTDHKSRWISTDNENKRFIDSCICFVDVQTGRVGREISRVTAPLSAAVLVYIDTTTDTHPDEFRRPEGDGDYVYFFSTASNSKIEGCIGSQRVSLDSRDVLLPSAYTADADDTADAMEIDDVDGAEGAEGAELTDAIDNDCCELTASFSDISRTAVLDTVDSVLYAVITDVFESLRIGNCIPKSTIYTRLHVKLVGTATREQVLAEVINELYTENAQVLRDLGTLRTICRTGNFDVGTVRRHIAEYGITDDLLNTKASVKQIQMLPATCRQRAEMTYSSFESHFIKGTKMSSSLTYRNVSKILWTPKQLRVLDKIKKMLEAKIERSDTTTTTTRFVLDNLYSAPLTLMQMDSSGKRKTPLYQALFSIWDAALKKMDRIK